MMRYIKLFEELNFLNENIESIKKLNSYKKILDAGFTDTSTPRQIQNGTFLFDNDPEDPNKGVKFSVHSNGYVRRMNKAPNSYGRHTPFGVVAQLAAPVKDKDWEILFDRMLSALDTTEKRGVKSDNIKKFDWKDYMSVKEWEMFCNTAEDFVKKNNIPKKDFKKLDKFFKSYESAIKDLNSFYDFAKGEVTVQKPGRTYPVLFVNDRSNNLDRVAKSFKTIKGEYLQMYGGYLGLGNHGLGIYPIKSRINAKISK